MRLGKADIDDRVGENITALADFRADIEKHQKGGEGDEDNIANGESRTRRRGRAVLRFGGRVGFAAGGIGRRRPDEQQADGDRGKEGAQHPKRHRRAGNQVNAEVDEQWREKGAQAKRKVDELQEWRHFVIAVDVNQQHIGARVEEADGDALHRGSRCETRHICDERDDGRADAGERHRERKKAMTRKPVKGRAADRRADQVRHGSNRKHIPARMRVRCGPSPGRGSVRNVRDIAGRLRGEVKQRRPERRQRRTDEPIAAEIQRTANVRIGRFPHGPRNPTADL